MIIPSIDLMQGKAVQLEQGRDKILEVDQPVKLAEEFTRFGETAVIDLDAALGQGENEATIRQICAKAECRIGGGIRTVEKAADIISLGAEKIIIGTQAYKDGRVNHTFLKALQAAVGRDRIIVAVDTFQGEILVKGWKESTGLRSEAILAELVPYASEFLCTCVEKEGMLKGGDLESMLSLQKVTDVEITAAGGITTTEEIAAFSSAGFNVQLGMAIYSEKLSLPEAFLAALDWSQELLPTITQDTSQQVLMQAYSSRESLAKTFETAKVWYYSRSRQKLWMKGETSGNIQKFQRIRRDCDGDALLITAEPAGPACHTRRYSCFNNKNFSWNELHEVLKDRLENPRPGSYTAQLRGPLLTAKILEEAQELVLAESREDVIWEAADLMYFIQVLLAKQGISPSEVLAELKRRRSSVKVAKKNSEGGGKKNAED